MNKKKLLDNISTSLYFLLILFLTFIIIKYVAQRTEVIGKSMEPTLVEGDNLLVDKISFKFREPERGEIVVFPYRDGSGIYYVKRVVGMPGETIWIPGDGYVYIDGERFKEEYVKGATAEGGIAITPITLGEDEYFLLGDNRGNSIDSRNENVGIVKEDEIIGKVVLRMWPVGNGIFVE